MNDTLIALPNGDFKVIPEMGCASRSGRTAKAPCERIAASDAGVNGIAAPGHAQERDEDAVQQKST